MGYWLPFAFTTFLPLLAHHLSLMSECRFAFVDEGIHALALVVRGEERVEELLLEFHPRFERGLICAIHCLPGQLSGQPAEISDLLGVLHAVRDEILMLHNLSHQARLLCIGG